MSLQNRFHVSNLHKKQIKKHQHHRPGNNAISFQIMIQECSHSIPANKRKQYHKECNDVKYNTLQNNFLLPIIKRENGIHKQQRNKMVFPGNPRQKMHGNNYDGN